MKEVNYSSVFRHPVTFYHKAYKPQFTKKKNLGQGINPPLTMELHNYFPTLWLGESYKLCRMKLLLQCILTPSLPISIVAFCLLGDVGSQLKFGCQNRYNSFFQEIW